MLPFSVLLLSLYGIPSFLLAQAAPQSQDDSPSTRRRCYWPNGSEMIPDYTPCVAGVDENGHSACCAGSNDVCLENGLCYWKEPALFFRNGCTDETWKSPSCANVGLSLPEVCSTGAAGSGSRQLFFCVNTEKWCCGDLRDASCCESEEGQFEMTNAGPASSTQTSTSRSVQTTRDSQRSTRTSTASNGAVVTFTAPSESCGSCEGERAKGAGIGVGATAAAAFVVAGVMFALMRRRTGPPAYTGQPYYGPAPQHDSPHELAVPTAELNGTQVTNAQGK